MDPINKKERTTSFLYFMIMLTVLIVFVMVGVFFDQKFFRKDYMEIKEDNKQLENIEVLNNKANALFEKIDVLKKKGDAAYKMEKERLESEIKDLKKVDGDTSNFDKMSISLSEYLLTLLYEIPNSQNANSCNELIKAEKAETEKVEAARKQLQKDFEQLEKEYNKCTRICPDC